MASELTPFNANLGTTQGRVDNPAGFDPTEGTAAFVLGTDVVGEEYVVRLGDNVTLTQNVNLTGADILQINAKLVPPDTIPLESANEPYNLTTGDSLQVSVDGGVVQVVNFATADFTTISAALAFEVAAKINSVLTGAKASAPDTSVQLTSNTSGADSSVAVVGGTAAAKLAFGQRAWRASLIVDGTTYTSRVIYPGRSRVLEMSANVSDIITAVDITFKLELVAL